MARTTTAPLPTDVIERIAQLGLRIRGARIRRRWRQADLADRTGLSRSTIEAVERGGVETSIGAYLRVLWVMGLDRELELVADPSIDKDGATLEYVPGERRVRVARGLNNDF